MIREEGRKGRRGEEREEASIRVSNIIRWVSSDTTMLASTVQMLLERRHWSQLATQFLCRETESREQFKVALRNCARGL